VLNFSTPLDAPVIKAPTPPPAVEAVPVITERVTIRRPETRVTDVGKDPGTWTWEDLRNYVVRSIEKIHGPFPRDSVKEKAIFSGFLSRWEDQAGRIAQFAFDSCDGMWRGAPIAVQRFCKASDPYFAIPIVERLTA
jgi:hypothetical protein